jgi:hypothetical protein
VSLALNPKVGRNDPCPCGSGKKYKRCCMARDKEAQAERVAWEHAAHDMRVALIGYAREGEFVRDLAAGLGLFWQDRYTAESVHLMSEDESLRFFDWFAHDYGLQHLDLPENNGKRLIELYRQQVADALSDKERVMLDGWIESLPGSAFALQETDSEQGTVVLDDLCLPDRKLTVRDQAAASYGEVGQILLARPLPEHEEVRLSGATAVLPASEREALCAFIDRAYAEYAGRGEGGAGEERDTALYVRFLRERAYLFTHYALEWAEREGRPAVSADDPEARRPGGQAVRRLVRWSQERVQSR